MPELPEAETIARQLAGQVVGQRISKAVLSRQDIIRCKTRGLARKLDGSKITAIERRGKRIRMLLQSEASLIFALGMTGRLSVVATECPIPKHTHLRLILEDGQREIRFCDPRRFGGIWYVRDHAPNRPIDPLALGPEPLTMTAESFRSLMSHRRQIKALLLDQHAIAGLGNIYCDEALHRAGVHPLTRAHELNDERIRGLFQSIRSVLRGAIRSGGSTIRDYRSANGTEGFFQVRHRVYGREGKLCRRCKHLIVRIQAAGRSSFLCTKCQPFSNGNARCGFGHASQSDDAL